MATVVGHVDVCPVCLSEIDPESHTRHVGTGERYCSGECWAKGVLD